MSSENMNPANMNSTNIKLKNLEAVLAEMGSVIVAFSGGVDSALLAKVSKDVLGDNAMAATAVSPSLATLELEHCQKLAEDWGLNWVRVETTEMELEAYTKNDLNRCYWCKASLMDALQGLKAETKTEDQAENQPKIVPKIVLGVNLDDLSDHRPGIEAAETRGALFPYLEAKITKADVREISQELGLKTWDKPAEPCLASRIPFGTKVSLETLGRIDRAEAQLKRLGFGQIRVRHYGDTARIEVPEEDFPAVMEARVGVLEAVKSAGYKFVALDLEELKTGKMTAAYLKPLNT